MTSKLRVLLLVVSGFMLAGLSLTVGLWAQAPNSISYSGLLTNAQGEPREGQFNLTFRIYDRPMGGAPLQPPQTINNVVVRKGQFSVLLGPFADTVFLQGGGNRFVEVQVGTEPPLLPRQQLTSVPFAQRAAKVGSIEGASGGAINGGLMVSGNVGIGTTTPGAKLDVRGSGQDLWVSGNATPSNGELFAIFTGPPM